MAGQGELPPATEEELRRVFALLKREYIRTQGQEGFNQEMGNARIDPSSGAITGLAGGDIDPVRRQESLQKLLAQLAASPDYDPRSARVGGYTQDEARKRESFTKMFGTPPPELSTGADVEPGATPEQAAEMRRMFMSAAERVGPLLSGDGGDQAVQEKPRRRARKISPEELEAQAIQSFIERNQNRFGISDVMVAPVPGQEYTRLPKKIRARVDEILKQFNQSRKSSAMPFTFDPSGLSVDDMEFLSGLYEQSDERIAKKKRGL